jgi:dTDP-4-amino-4,6-dideoxygalactose transaminase
MLDGSPYPGGCPFTCRPAPERQDYRTLFLPNVEAIAGNIIGLPNHAQLTENDINYVIEIVKNIY